MSQTFDEYVNAKVFFHDNTSKVGFAFINTINDKILFRETKKGDKIKYSSKEVSRLILKKDTIVREFRYKRANDRRAPRLLQLVIENKKASLFVKLTKVQMLGLIGAVVNWEDVDYIFYLVKDQSEMAYFIGERGATSKKGIAKMIKKHFSDCSELMTKAENKQYRLKDIREIISIYNNCSQQIE